MILQNDLAQWFECPFPSDDCKQLFRLGRQLAARILLLCDDELSLQAHMIYELRLLVAGLCARDGAQRFHIALDAAMQFLPSLVEPEQLSLPIREVYELAWALCQYLREPERQILRRICHQIELCQIQMKVKIHAA